MLLCNKGNEKNTVILDELPDKVDILSERLSLNNEFLLIQNQQLLSQIEEREKLEQALKLLVHTVGHDLKNTLLGWILTLNNLLNKQEVNVCQVERQVLEVMRLSCKKQQTLIDSMIDSIKHFNGLEQMLYSLDFVSCSLHDIVESVLSEWESVLNTYQVKVENKIPADLPKIRGDEVQLCRVFENLISNAVKYNQSGVKITITAEVIGNKVRVWVCDNGRGISKSLSQNLFKPYQKGEEADRTNRFGYSCGLGLYICQKIIQGLGGEIGLDENATGAAFWFTLQHFE